MLGTMQLVAGLINPPPPPLPPLSSIGDLTSRVTDLIISFVEHVVVLVKWAQL